MIESLDREARRLGVNRQSIIKVWIAERLERSGSSSLQLPGTETVLAVEDGGAELLGHDHEGNRCAAG
jgi:hypothetical protein